MLLVQPSGLCGFCLQAGEAASRQDVRAGDIRITSSRPQRQGTLVCMASGLLLATGVLHQLLPWGCHTSPTCTNQLELGLGDSSGHRILPGTPGRHLPQPRSLQKELPPSLCTLHKAGRLLDLAAIACSSDRLAKVGSDPQIVPELGPLGHPSYLLFSLTQASLLFEVPHLSRP